MRRTMILTIEAEGEDEAARFAVAMLEGRLMRAIMAIDEQGGIDGVTRAMFCASPLSDTLIERLARPVQGETNEPAPPRRNGRRLHLS
jgi:hypothetical protein